LRFRSVAGLPIFPINRDGTIELQITDIIPSLAVDMIEDLGIGEVTVEGLVTRDALADHPIDQFLAQDSVVLEGRAFGSAEILLPKAAKFQG
jgi:hypothetical protein